MVGAVLDNSNLNEAQGWAASAVARQRNYFESGATRSYAFRLRQLKKLQEAIVQYQGQIQDALHADIGRPPFEAYIEISTAIEDLKHLKNWMKHATRNTQHATRACRCRSPLPGGEPCAARHRPKGDQAFQRATGFRKYFAAEMFPSPRLGFAPRAALLQWPCRFLAIRH